METINSWYRLAVRVNPSPIAHYLPITQAPPAPPGQLRLVLCPPVPVASLPFQSKQSHLSCPAPGRGVRNPSQARLGPEGCGGWGVGQRLHKTFGTDPWSFTSPSHGIYAAPRTPRLPADATVFGPWSLSPAVPALPSPTQGDMGLHCPWNPPSIVLLVSEPDCRGVRHPKVLGPVTYQLTHDALVRDFQM